MALSDLIPRGLRAGVLLASLSVAAVACSDSDPVDPDPEPDIHQVVVQVQGGMQITFNRARVASGPLTIEDGDVVTLSFRGPDGEPEEVIASHPERFELRVAYSGDNPAGLSFMPSATGEFTGTFTASGTTPTDVPTAVQFQLWHVDDDRLVKQWNANVTVI